MDVLPTTRKRLGEYLIDEGKISEQELQVALREQQQTEELLGETLVRLGFISRATLTAALASQTGTATANVRELKFDRSLTQVITESMAKQYRIVPLIRRDDVLVVGMVDHFDIQAIDTVSAQIGLELNVEAISEEDYVWVLDNLYGGLASMETSFEAIVEEAKTSNLDEAAEGEAPIIRLVNHLIARAAREGATDIHIEPEEKVVRCRFRVDGLCIQGPSIPKELQPALTSRIKIMSGLNISESRVPQDGRIEFTLGSRRLDLRVSTFPTVYGEDTVMRLLDKEKLALGLSNLGFEDDTLAIFEELIQRPYGIILVTGPTGSGKTTTLYSSLLEIDAIQKNVITLEDPVEYFLPLIRQSQINSKAGLTFATGLRAILRQDPDVILVGEVRDGETAEMAVRAALTGHLVFSTLHTNDAAGSISRLIDMGIEPFLVNSVLLAVMAQRLVRINCRHCKTEYVPEKQTLSHFQRGELKRETFWKGVGCEECNNLGYRGRKGVFELLTFSRKIEELVVEGAPATAIRDSAIKAGMRTMRDDALLKAYNGITSLEEVARVT